jgi:flavin reductase (DIM6/NTAB) family NADH-FMN oxidoreductase RutF
MSTDQPDSSRYRRTKNSPDGNRSGRAISCTPGLIAGMKRRVQTPGPGTMTDIDAHDAAVGFKAAMRRLAASVTIVTTRESGMTATAVTSLSGAPPSLLACVNRSASIHVTLQPRTRFCVNILAQTQAEIARQCSGALPPAERFNTEAWRRDRFGVPFLEAAQANLFCEVDALTDYGTHTIVIGRVLEVLLAETADGPLVYLDGAFVRACPLSEP